VLLDVDDPDPRVTQMKMTPAEAWMAADRERRLRDRGRKPARPASSPATRPTSPFFEATDYRHIPTTTPRSTSGSWSSAERLRWIETSAPVVS